MLQESSTIFSWEPEETDEGQLAVISAKELDTLMILGINRSLWHIKRLFRFFFRLRLYRCFSYL